MDASNDSPPQTRRRRSVATSNEGGVVDSNGRRKACNQCKQQKLRCVVSSAEQPGPSAKCARCERLNLDCRIEDGFRRTRKRRRSTDLEDEIRGLRQQLEDSHRTAASEPSSTASAIVASTGIGDHWASAPTPSLLPSLQMQPAIASTSTVPVEDPSGSPQADDTEHFQTQGVTTRPGLDEPTQPPQWSHPLPRPRALGNIALSVEEIEELFTIYLTHHHPFLPIIDATKSAQEHFQQSELLFWTIISVASRRLRSHPTLLPRLARNVTDLLWRTVRCVPRALPVVQAIAVLCTWPFPTSSSTADPTFMLTGLMLQIGTQMGLHRVHGAQDFGKSSLTLDIVEFGQWERTWEACHIVAQSVSVGCGLPNPIQPHDWPRSWTTSSPATAPSPFLFHMRIEKFRQRVSMALAAREAPGNGVGTFMAEDRLNMYRLHSLELNDLYAEQPPSTPLMPWFLAAARLHLQAFYLLDHASLPGYNDRICALYATAASLLELSLTFDGEANHLLPYCPFFSYQVFVCAAFCVLKIISNGFFRTILDPAAGAKLLETAIASLRTISVVNNDLPARLGDVIAFFCALPDLTMLGGMNAEDVCLKQVTNRLSMSVVYDCLWTWRRQFQPQRSEGRRTDARESEDKLLPFTCGTHRAMRTWLTEESRDIYSADDLQRAFGFNSPLGTGDFFDMDWSSAF